MDELTKCRLSSPARSVIVESRPGPAGKRVSYIPCDILFAEANRIIGAWSSEVRDLVEVNRLESNGRHTVTHRAIVRVTVGDQMHEDTDADTVR